MNRALKIAKVLNSKLIGRVNSLELFMLFEDFESSKVQINPKEASLT